MKKKIFLFTFMYITTFYYTQCIISGPNSFLVGQTVQYSIPNLAQCSECYDWDITGTNVEIIGSDQNNIVNIRGLATGTFSLNVTYFDETGCHTCTLNGSCSAGCCTIEDFNFDSDYICQAGNGRGFIEEILGDCDINTISKFDIRLSCGIFTNGPLVGLAYGTIYAPFDPLFIENDVLLFKNCNCNTSGGIGSTYSITITYHFNNGCTPIQVQKHFIYETLTRGFSNEISIYPNPATNEIQFSGDIKDSYCISIFDEGGNEVISKAKLNTKVDIKKLKSGVYYYKIFDDQVEIQSDKIIKK